jgi:hypothetical protein
MHGGRGKKERMKKNIYSTRFCLKMMIFTNQHRTEKKIFKNSCPVNVKFQNFWRNCTFFFFFRFSYFHSPCVFYFNAHTQILAREKRKIMSMRRVLCARPYLCMCWCLKTNGRMREEKSTVAPKDLKFYVSCLHKMCSMLRRKKRIIFYKISFYSIVKRRTRFF